MADTDIAMWGFSGPSPTSAASETVGFCDFITCCDNPILTGMHQDFLSASLTPLRIWCTSFQEKVKAFTEGSTIPLSILDPIEGPVLISVLYPRRESPVSYTGSDLFVHPSSCSGPNLSPRPYPRSFVSWPRMRCLLLPCSPSIQKLMYFFSQNHPT